MKLNEKQLWKLIEKANWKKDGDYERIQKELGELPKDEFEQLEEFARNLHGDLMDKFHEDWLDNPGISASDDGWTDLTAEVVGRGKKFYESITVKKLQKMADSGDYTENFMYSFHQD